MVPVILIPVVVFIFTLGKATAPKPEVVLMKDGSIVESVRPESDKILVVVEGDKVSVMEARDRSYAVNTQYPFYRDSMGRLEADCQDDCDK